MAAIDFTAEAYVDDVLSGNQIASRWVRLACERYVRDREHGHLRGLRFDDRAAQVAVAFFSVLHHWKGEWSGRPIHLEPWQQFVVWNLFGWKRDDGTRRFRTAYLEVARKNGKTTLAAGIGLLLMLIDGEPGAEIYTAATKRDQARIAHRDAVEMVKRSPQLREMVQSFKDNLHYEATSSKFEPLGRDSNSMDGLNIHGAICDELHAWRDRGLWDVLETATGARRQPLMLAITTAGYDRFSLCYQLHDYAEKVALGAVEDDSFFGLIYTIDEADDWEDEQIWVKANPNLDISKKRDDMLRLAERARVMPAQLNAFLRLHLNVWTQAESRWIDPARWRACGGEPVPDLNGRACYGGLDLSSTTDVTAWVLVFPPEREGEPYWVRPTFWIPDEQLHERSKRDRVPYEDWLRRGLVEATPGSSVDYDWIEAQLLADAQRYRIQEIAFDPWNATSVSNHLIDQGLPMIEFRQGFVSMNPAMKALEVAIVNGQIGHGGNLPLTWMADNLVARQDPAGNLKPDKEKSTEKIDGMVALIMAHYRATLASAKPSVYEGRGMRFV